MRIESVSLRMRQKARKRVRVVRRGEGDRVAAGLLIASMLSGVRAYQISRYRFNPISSR